MLVADKDLCMELSRYITLDTAFQYAKIENIKLDERYEWERSLSGGYDALIETKHVTKGMMRLPAPTAGELLRLLPEEVIATTTGGFCMNLKYRLHIEKQVMAEEMTIVSYVGLQFYEEPKPENALIKMLIYLYKEGLI